jgi:hypothetical protein
LDRPIYRAVKANWEFLVAFKEQHVNEMRYLPASQWTKSQAEEVLNRLQLAPHGVLVWLDSQA